MKKALIVVLSALLVSAMAIPALASDPESTNTANAVKVANDSITIDAVKDDLYDTGAHITIAEQNLDYFPASLEDSNGEAWIVFDDNYIYVYVDIYDEEIDYSNADPSQTWNRESIGICIDFDYNRSVDYEYSYADNGDHVAYVNLSGDGVLVTYHMYTVDALLNAVKFSTVSKTDDNHILYEVACPIPGEDYGVSIVDGQKVGFEICAPNAYAGSRNGNISWSPSGTEMWHYLHVMGTLVLGGTSAATTETTETTAAAETETTVDEEVPTVDTTEAAAETVETAETATETVATPATTTSAPQTFDAGIIAACAVIVSSGAALLVGKKKH